MGKLLRNKKIIVLLLITTVFSAMVFYIWPKQNTIEPVQAQSLGDTHPFLIIKEDMYPELRSRASNQPWKDMKTQAINYVNSNSYNVNDNAADKHYKIRHIVTTGALAYILDPVNKVSYKNKIRDALLKWDDALAAIEATEINWNKHVPPGSSFFLSVLALDIIYNDLSASERSGIEYRLDQVEQMITSRNTWYLNKYSVSGIWNIYNGNLSAANSDISSYTSRLNSYLSDDGVFNGGPDYGWVRLNAASDRGSAKTGFMDVTEFTGLASFYNNPLYAKMYEWMYAGALTPFKYWTIFGDTPSYDTNNWSSFRIFSVYRFSDKAARYASWLKQDMTNTYNNNDLLLTYVLMDQPMLEPEKPKSTIWPDGGAAFWEDNPSEHSLAGVLWNLKSSQAHSHYDVNAVHIAAFGENILRNSGYTGWGSGVDETFTWSWIHFNAQSNNTVKVQNSNHVSDEGAGVTEGFLGSLFDYVSGDSGAAVNKGHHQRNFVMVHPQDNAEGYFVLFDEVTVDDPTYYAEVYLHPDSATYTTVSPSQEYRWTINHYSGHNVYANIFLATLPTNVAVVKGGIANFGDSYITRYLISRYVPRSGNKINAVTIIFPSDDSHLKAEMTRITDTAYTGAEINLGNGITDYALESLGSSIINHSGVSFQGLASLYRMQNSLNQFYFVRRGSSFDDGAPQRHGFESDNDVSVYLKDTWGKIISAGTNVTFYYPGISGLEIDGQTASVTSSGNGWVKVNVPSGTHDLLLTASGSSCNIIDTNCDQSIDLQDFQNLKNNWGTNLSDFNQDDITNTQDFGIMMSKWGNY